MPYQVDHALLHAMSGTAYEPNSGSFLLSLTTKDCSRREEPTLLCNQVQSQYFKFPITVYQDLASETGLLVDLPKAAT
jgi:hypothetical protein